MDRCVLFERVHRPGSTKVTHCYSAVKVAATWGVGFCRRICWLCLYTGKFKDNLFFKCGILIIEIGDPSFNGHESFVDLLYICLQEAGRSALRYVHVLVTPFLVFF